ncbi:MAG: hypothetical protein ABJG88_12450 [Litorimonas sp.]
MKWLFRTILGILLVFVIFCTVGFFLPATQIVETHLSVETYPEEVFDELSDLRGYPAWFHGFEDIEEGQIIFAGTERGVGQSAAWRQKSGNGDNFGNIDILQIQTDELVSLRHEFGPHIIAITYALEGDEANEAVLLLARYEAPLGGFPYLSRLRGKLAAGGVANDLDISLQKLKTILEAKTTQ